MTLENNADLIKFVCNPVQQIACAMVEAEKNNAKAKVLEEKNDDFVHNKDEISKEEIESLIKSDDEAKSRDEQIKELEKSKEEEETKKKNFSDELKELQLLAEPIRQCFLDMKESAIKCVQEYKANPEFSKLVLDITNHIESNFDKLDSKSQNTLLIGALPFIRHASEYLKNLEQGKKVTQAEKQKLINEMDSLGEILFEKDEYQQKYKTRLIESLGLGENEAKSKEALAQVCQTLNELEKPLEDLVEAKKDYKPFQQKIQKLEVKIRKSEKRISVLAETIKKQKISFNKYIQRKRCEQRRFDKKIEEKKQQEKKRFERYIEKKKKEEKRLEKIRKNFKLEEEKTTERRIEEAKEQCKTSKPKLAVKSFRSKLEQREISPTRMRITASTKTYMDVKASLTQQSTELIQAINSGNPTEIREELAQFFSRLENLNDIAYTVMNQEGELKKLMADYKHAESLLKNNQIWISCDMDHLT